MELGATAAILIVDLRLASHVDAIGGEREVA